MRLKGGNSEFLQRYKIHTTGKPNSYSPNPDKATKGTVESGLKNLNKYTEVRLQIRRVEEDYYRKRFSKPSFIGFRELCQKPQKICTRKA